MYVQPKDASYYSAALYSYATITYVNNIMVC